MKKKCKIVMLPADGKSYIFLKFNDALEYNEHSPYYGIKHLDWKYQHLYVLSPDEEIRIEDWYIANFTYLYQHRIGFPLYGITAYKVISSNDPSLNLPLIPTIYLKEYISSYNAGNIPTEVEVEYEERDEFFELDYKFKTKGNFSNKKIQNLKLSPNNEIVIKKTKDSWTREEVIELIKKASVIEFDPNWCMELHLELVNNWIKANL